MPGETAATPAGATPAGPLSPIETGTALGMNFIKIGLSGTLILSKRKGLLEVLFSLK